LKDLLHIMEQVGGRRRRLPKHYRGSRYHDRRRAHPWNLVPFRRRLT
jgi:hypothetical protein